MLDNVLSSEYTDDNGSLKRWKKKNPGSGRGQSQNLTKDKPMSKKVKPIAFGKSVSSKTPTVDHKEITFSQFCEMFREPGRLNVTGEEYWKLGKKEQGELKVKASGKSGYWTPCNFKKPLRRKNNADKVQLVNLDIDTGEFAGSFDPATLADSLKGFSWMIHTTASHTVQDPRYHVLVDADGTIEPLKYAACVATLSKLIGMPPGQVTKESFTVCQAMFMPVIPQGAEYLFDSCDTGRPFTADDICMDALEAVQQATLNKKRTNGAKPLMAPQTVDDDPFESAISRTPADESPERIKSALDSIDPDGDREQWYIIAGCLKHQFQGDPESGFQMFHDWSATGEKYVDEQDCRKQWDHEKANPEDKEPVRIATLFGMARDAGWNEKATLEARIESVESLEAMESIYLELKKAKLGRAVRNHLYRAIKQRLKAIGHESTIPKIRFACQPEIAEADYAWLEDWIFVEDSDPYYRQVSIDTVEQSTGIHLRGAMKVKKFNEAFGHLCPPNDEGKCISPHDAAARQGIPRVASEIYHTGLEPGLCLYQGMERFNRYQSPTVKPDPAQLDKATRLLDQLLLNLSPCKDERDMLMNWLACLVQHPEIRFNWAPILQGIQGTGKGFIHKLLSSLLGKRQVEFLGTQTLKDNFNGWVGSCQVAFVDEIKISGEGKYDALDKLKGYIGNDQVRVRKMHTDSVEVENFMSFIFTTNYHDAIPINDGDRRYYPIFSGMTIPERNTPKMKNFFIDLHSEKTLSELLPAYMHILMNHAIPAEFDPKGCAPDSESRKHLIEGSKDSLTNAIEDAIENTEIPLVGDVVLSIRALHDYLESEGFKKNNAVSKYLNDMGWEKAIDPKGGALKKSIRHQSIGSRKHHLWVNRGKLGACDPLEIFEKMCQDSESNGEL